MILELTKKFFYGNGMIKLILGTAQFGSNYGIKKDGQPSLQEIEKIAQVAWDGGIRVIHTSWQYNLSDECKVILHDFEWIAKSWGDPNYFWWNYKEGKSFYSPSEWNAPYRMAIIPINILDKRFKNIWEYKSNGTILIARSVFLQGLLLMEPEKMPDWIPIDVKTMIFAFHFKCEVMNLRPYEAALGWVLGLEDIDYVIVGVNNAEQLRQLLEVKPLRWDYDFSIQDEMVLDPRKWPQCA